MYDHTLHLGKKHFCCFCLQAFRTAEMWKTHVDDCLNVNGKQITKMSVEGEYVRFKNYKRNIKSPFMIYADFESILVPEENGK